MKPETKKKALRITLRSVVIFLTVVVLLAATLYGVMWILVNGPSPTARRLFVLSVKETSAGGFLADIYLSSEEIDKILNGDSSELSNDTTDSSLIKIPHKDGEDNVIGEGGTICCRSGRRKRT